MPIQRAEVYITPLSYWHPMPIYMSATKCVIRGYAFFCVYSFVWASKHNEPTETDQTKRRKR